MRVIEQIMHLARTTKRTYRFETDNPKDDSLGVLYIQQSAFPSKPETIRVFVEVDE